MADASTSPAVPSWDKIAADPEFQKLPAQQRQNAQDDYFRDHVLPGVMDYTRKNDKPFERNQAYAVPPPKKGGTYQTQLSPEEEHGFKQWVHDYHVPFEEKPDADYDMRGFYQALRGGDPKATSAIDPNDGKIHYPDYWKTPYHATFSRESQWATADAPGWKKKSPDDKTESLLVDKNGRVLFDDTVGGNPEQVQKSYDDFVGANPVHYNTGEYVGSALPKDVAASSNVMLQGVKQAIADSAEGAGDAYRAAVVRKYLYGDPKEMLPESRKMAEDYLDQLMPKLKDPSSDFNKQLKATKQAVQESGEIERPMSYAQKQIAGVATSLPQLAAAGVASAAGGPGAGATLWSATSAADAYAQSRAQNQSPSDALSHAALSYFANAAAFPVAEGAGALAGRGTMALLGKEGASKAYQLAAQRAAGYVGSGTNMATLNAVQTGVETAYDQYTTGKISYADLASKVGKAAADGFVGGMLFHGLHQAGAKVLDKGIEAYKARKTAKDGEAKDAGLERDDLPGAEGEQQQQPDQAQLPKASDFKPSAPPDDWQQKADQLKADLEQAKTEPGKKVVQNLIDRHQKIEDKRLADEKTKFEADQKQQADEAAAADLRNLAVKAQKEGDSKRRDRYLLQAERLAPSEKATAQDVEKEPVEKDREQLQQVRERERQAQLEKSRINDQEHQLGAASQNIEVGELDRETMNDLLFLHENDPKKFDALSKQHAGNMEAFHKAVKEEVHGSDDGAVRGGGEGDQRAPQARAGGDTGKPGEAPGAAPAEGAKAEVGTQEGADAFLQRRENNRRADELEKRAEELFQSGASQDKWLPLRQEAAMLRRGAKAAKKEKPQPEQQGEHIELAGDVEQQRGDKPPPMPAPRALAKHPEIRIVKGVPLGGGKSATRDPKTGKRLTLIDESIPEWVWVPQAKQWVNAWEEIHSHEEREEKFLDLKGYGNPRDAHEEHGNPATAQYLRENAPGVKYKDYAAALKPHLDKARGSNEPPHPDLDRRPYQITPELLEGHKPTPQSAATDHVFDREGNRYSDFSHTVLLPNSKDDKVPVIIAQGDDGKWAVIDPKTAHVIARGETKENARHQAGLLAATKGRARLRKELDQHPRLTQDELRDRYVAGQKKPLFDLEGANRRMAEVQARNEQLKAGKGEPIKIEPYTTLDQHFPRYEGEPSTDEALADHPSLARRALDVLNNLRQRFADMGYKQEDINSGNASQATLDLKKHYQSVGGRLSRYSKQHKANERGYKGQRQVDDQALYNDRVGLEKTIAEAEAALRGPVKVKPTLEKVEPTETINYAGKKRGAVATTAEVRLGETPNGWVNSVSYQHSSGNFQGQGSPLLDRGPYYPTRDAAANAGLQELIDRNTRIADGKDNSANPTQVEDAQKMIDWAKSKLNEEKPSAEEVRSDAGQVPEPGAEGTGGQEEGRPDLQQPAQQGPKAGDQEGLKPGQEPFQDERLQDNGPALVEMAKGAGWKQLGRQERGPDGKVVGIPGEPHQPWFGEVQRAPESKLKGNTDGEATREAVRKALAGEPMSAPEKAHVKGMLDHLEKQKPEEKKHPLIGEHVSFRRKGKTESGTVVSVNGGMAKVLVSENPETGIKVHITTPVGSLKRTPFAGMIKAGVPKPAEEQPPAGDDALIARAQRYQATVDNILEASDAALADALDYVNEGLSNKRKTDHGGASLGTLSRERAAIQAEQARRKGGTADQRFMNEVRNRLLPDGKPLETIRHARDLYAAITGAEASNKKVDELVEQAVVQRASEIAKGKGTDQEKFRQLVDLYSRQPRLATRSSTSVEQQAYSTPAPLAYIASRLAEVDKNKSVLEPTAGNGMLLIEANPEKTTANELNQDRAEALRKRGFRVSQQDAAKANLRHKGYPVDIVLANPPFGVVKDAEGASSVFEAPQYATREIDHAIALRALESLKDDGKAVLIVGGPNKLAASREARSDAYNGAAKRRFYYHLYKNYNVTDHFTVAGDLYERQGAGWPVDVIVINGRGESARGLPAVDVPPVLNSWDELASKLPAGGVEPDSGRAGAVPGRGADASGSPDGAGPVPVGAGGAVPEAGGPQPEGESAGAGGGSGERGAVGGAGQRGPGGSGLDTDLVQPSGAAAAASLGSEQPEGSGARGAAGSEGADQPGSSGPGKPDELLGEPAGKPPVEGPLSADDLSKLFDEAASELRQPEAKPPESKSTTGTRASGGGSRGPRPPREPSAPPPTASGAIKEAAKLGVKGIEESAKGLSALFGVGKKGQTLGAGPVIDEETWQAALPHFHKAWDAFKAAGRTIKDYFKYLIENFGEGIKHYAIKFVQQATSEAPKPPPQTEEVKSGPNDKPVPVSKQAMEGTDTQVPYVPGNNAPGLATLVPTNMEKPTQDSLKGLKDRVGDLKHYVAVQLGYSPDEMDRNFSAEQVDALGLALDSLGRGAGFILGDQTGIGKGRVVAGLLRWALKNEKTPIFVTHKPNLYADMYRDLTDIGVDNIRPFVTNAGEKFPLDDAGNVVIRTAPSPKHNKAMQDMINSASLGDYNMIFTTYDQLQTVDKRGTARMDFVKAFAPGSVIVFDESHNAGGNDSGRPGKAQKAQDTNKTGRAAFVRGLADAADSVAFSSATFAKRPSVMDLYARTDMRQAVEKPSDLPKAISAGGVPLQQVVASMLAKAGQYIRRERSFKGINYDTPVVPVNRHAAEQISSIMLAVKKFDDAKKAAIKAIKDDIKADAAQLTEDGSVGEAGATSVNFTSVMHNLIDQMLLALKADAAVERAKIALDQGRKPVITVSNTMGSFIEKYAQDAGLNPGDTVGLGFKDLLKRYLDRSREVTIKDVRGNPTKHYLTDEQLGESGMAAYKYADDLIKAATGMDNVPASPIDYIHAKLQGMGYRTSEITGRKDILEYQPDGRAILRRRGDKHTSIAGRRAAITSFNGGDTDVMILNQAGSTGLSLHASEKFKDQKPRRMIIAQAEKNIDTHMQMLGRTNRTGQVNLPDYEQLVADIPAEKRPAAVLAKKMASLNASTTAARDSAVTSKTVVDFINEYGDAVVSQLMADNREIHDALGEPLDVKDTSTGLEIEEAARKVTGRIPMLPVEEQEQLYQQIEDGFKAAIARAEAMGENALEARLMPLDAKLETSVPLTNKGDTGSPFADAAYAEVSDVKRLGKPMTSQQVTDNIAERVGKPPGMVIQAYRPAAREQQIKLINDTTAAFDAYVEKSLEGLDPEKQETKGRQNMFAGQRVDWTNAMKQVWPGMPVLLRLGDGTGMYGVVLGIDRTGKTKNPMAMGSWSVDFALADAARRVSVPLSQLSIGAEKEGKINVGTMPDGRTLIGKSILNEFDEGQTQSRERRVIVTGNLLGGFSKVGKGQIVNFTDSDGHVRQGIMMPKTFDLEQFAKDQPIILKPEHVVAFFGQAPRGEVTTPDGGLTIRQWSPGEFRASTPKSKSEGGKYFLDPEIRRITRDFESSGDRMIAVLDANKTQRLAQLLADRKTPLQTSTFREEARAVGGRSAMEEAAKHLKDQQRAARKQEPPETLETSARHEPVGRFKELEGPHQSPQQAYDDAARLTGLHVNIPVKSVDHLDPDVPMQYNLDTRTVEVNSKPARPMTRASAAYYMAEELLHSIDHVGGKRTLSAGSPRLAPEGDLMREAMGVFDAGKEYADQLSYPLDYTHEMADHRLRAELFARLGTLYFADPETMKRLLPLAYGAFHDHFQLAPAPKDPGTFVHGKVWTGAPRFGEAVQRDRTDAGVQPEAQRGDRLGQPDRGLGPSGPGNRRGFRTGDLRSALAGSLRSSRLGTRANLSGVESRAEPARATDTPEFKSWFGNSKVVDAEGKPLVVYHATTRDFDTFKPGGNEPQQSGRAIWLSPNKSEYRSPSIGGYQGNYKPGTNVMPLYAKIERPLIIDKDTYAWATQQYGRGAFPLVIEPGVGEKVQRDGYDGILYYGRDRANTSGPPQEVIAFRPDQVKSAIGNKGTYGPSPNVLESRLPFSKPPTPIATAGMTTAAKQVAAGMDMKNPEMIRDVGRGSIEHAFAVLQRFRRKAEEGLYPWRRGFDEMMSTAAGKAAMRNAEYQWESGKPVTGSMQIVDANGKKKTVQMSEFFDAMKRAFDQRVKAVIASGREMGYLQNYFPHLYKDKDGAERWIKNYLTTHPLEGGKGWTKERFYETLEDARKAGLEPISENPADLVQAHLGQLDKYLAMHQIVSDLDARGLLAPGGRWHAYDRNGDRVQGKSWDTKAAAEAWRRANPGHTTRFDDFAKQRIPDGWAKVDDPAFNDKLIPELIAKDLSTILGPSLYRSPGFTGLRRVQNSLVSAALGLSGYHATMTTGDTIAAHIGDAIQRATIGDIGGTVRSLKDATLSMAVSPIKGSALAQQSLGRDAKGRLTGLLGLNGPADAHTAALLRMLEEGGHQIAMSPTELNDSGVKLMRLIRQGEWRNGLKGSALTAAAAGHTALENITPLIHKYLVPAQKMTAKTLALKFELDALAKKYDLRDEFGKRIQAGDYVKLEKALSIDAQRQIARKVVDQVDDRLGQRNYRSLYMNRTSRDILQAAMMSPGWLIGSLRTIGLGVADLRKLYTGGDVIHGSLDRAGKITNAQLHRLSGRTAYLVGLHALVMGVAVGMTYALTGLLPGNDIRNYYTIRTGRKNDDGSDERLSFPSYLRDEAEVLHGTAQNPLRALPNIGHMFVNKLNPTWRLLSEVGSNKDFFGNHIYDPDAPIGEQSIQVGEHLAKAAIPFSVAGARRSYEQGGVADAGANLLGFNPAPGYMVRSPFQDYLDLHAQDHTKAVLTPEQAASKQKFWKAVNAIRAGEEPDMEGLTPKEQESIGRYVDSDAPQAKFSRLTLPQKIEAWKRATPEEREQYKMQAHIFGGDIGNELAKLPEDQQEAIEAELDKIGEEVQ